MHVFVDESRRRSTYLLASVRVMPAHLTAVRKVVRGALLGSQRRIISWTSGSTAAASSLTSSVAYRSGLSRTGQSTRRRGRSLQCGQLSSS